MVQKRSRSRKYSLVGATTLTSQTFGKIKFSLGNKKTLYLHSFSWCLEPSAVTDFAADEDDFHIQITRTDQSANVGYDHNGTVYIEKEGTYGAGVMAPVEANKVRLSGFEQFKPALRIGATVEDFWIGVTHVFPGNFSVKLLVSDMNVAL